jgi:hypothetical protein
VKASKPGMGKTLGRRLDERAAALVFYDPASVWICPDCNQVMPDPRYGSFEVSHGASAAVVVRAA